MNIHRDLTKNLKILFLKVAEEKVPSVQEKARHFSFFSSLVPQDQIESQNVQDLMPSLPIEPSLQPLPFFSELDYPSLLGII